MCRVAQGEKVSLILKKSCQKCGISEESGVSKNYLDWYFLMAEVRVFVVGLQIALVLSIKVTLASRDFKWREN